MAEHEPEEVEEVVDDGSEVYLRPMYDWSPALDEYLTRLLAEYDTLGQRVQALERAYPRPLLAPSPPLRQMAS